MATTLPTLPSPAGSPGSPVGAVASPGGKKMNKAEAKKALRERTNQIAEGIRLTVTYADKLHEVPKGQKLAVVVDGRTYQIGRQEYKEFVSQLAKAVKEIPNMAVELLKTRRDADPDAGFNAPARMVPAMVEFFREANIGPQVQGQFTINKDGKPIPNKSTLQVLQNTRLNDALAFVQAGNLQGIIRPGTLNPLFALHAFYNTDAQGNRVPMFYPNETARLSASQLMREKLGDVMRRTIDTDVAKLSRDLPAQAGQIQQAGEQLKQAINDPSILHQKVEFGGKEMFNPNYWLYAHSSKLSANAKEGDRALNANELQQLGGDALRRSLDEQKATASLASAHKNKLTQEAARQRKAAEKAAAQ